MNHHHRRLSAAFLKRAVSAAPAWTPATLPSVAAWYQADKGVWQDAAGTVPATATGHPVGRWSDQSGNNNHATQATAGLRPTLTLAALGGKAVVTCDGASNVLALTAGIALVDPFTLYAVGHRADLAEWVPVGALGTGGGCLFLHTNGAAFIRNDSYNFIQTPFDPSGDFAVGFATALDNSAVVSGTGVAPAVFSSPVPPLTITALLANINNSWYTDGTIAEIVLVAGAVASGDAAKLGAYFSSRYGVTIP